MARQEKPLDPASGPLYLFARDLRLLRREAGNPGYRTLQKTAGFSAPTLSEAAKGTRLPSLDVTLAYVGACGGDMEAWRARWLAVREELDATSSPAPVPAATEPAEPPPAHSEHRDDQAEQPSPHRRSLWRPRPRSALAAAAAVLVIAALVAIANRNPRTPVESATSGSEAPTPPTVQASPATTLRTPERARPQAQAELPFTAAVAVNPVNEIVAQGGYRYLAYVFNKPPTSLTPLPPDYRNAGIYTAWAYANEGSDADATYVEITVQGKDGSTIALNSLDIYIHSRSRPPGGHKVQLSSGRFNPRLEIRRGEVDLDDAAPKVDMRGPLPTPGIEEFGYRLSDDEQISIRIQATTTRYDCVWYAKLRYTADGVSGTTTINNNGKPFRTTASTDATVYTVGPDGSIQPGVLVGR